jgi:hypothetical protein
MSPQKTIFPAIPSGTQIESLAGERKVIIFPHFKFTVEYVQFLQSTK